MATALVWVTSERAVASDGRARPCVASACSFVVRGGAMELRFAEGDIRCSSIDGQGHLDAGSGLGSTVLVFHDCREQMTPFRFSCAGRSGQAQPVTSNRMETSLRPERTRDQVIVFGNLRLGLHCAGFLDFAVEGYWQGRVVPSRRCRRPSVFGPLSMTLYAHASRGIRCILRRLRRPALRYLQDLESVAARARGNLRWCSKQSKILRVGPRG